MTVGTTSAGIRLFALTDVAHFPDCIEQSEALCRVAKTGTLAVVLREREASGRKLLEWAKSLRKATAKWGQQLFISDRADLAKVVGADGVHLPSEGLAPRQVSTFSELTVSRSGHHLENLVEEDWRRLSVVWISPVGAPRKGRAALYELGLRERIEWVRAQAPHVSVYALGGVTPENVESWQRAGATGVAAIGAVWERNKCGALIKSLRIER